MLTKNGGTIRHYLCGQPVLGKIVLRKLQMASEELHQRGLIRDGKLKGSPFGKFEDINIGSSKISALSMWNNGTAIRK